MKKRGAMEMSVGTIVTIVLLMSVLVLGLIMVRSIFMGGTTSVTKINDKVSSQIDELFASDENLRVAIYPSDYKIKLKQGTRGEGFAFSISNKNLESAKFKYEVGVNQYFDMEENCNINSKIADSWILQPEGEILLGGSTDMTNPKLILFNIPENAPRCTIPFKLEITEGGDPYEEVEVFLTIV